MVLDATNIVRLYQSIQHKEGLKSLTEELAEESSSKMCSIDFTKITNFVLKNKLLENCDKIKNGFRELQSILKLQPICVNLHE